MSRALVMAFVLSATPALAFDTSKLDQGGSLTLDEIATLVDQAPRLKQEVDRLLAEQHKKMEDIVCTGKRFSNAWPELGGLRAAPYDCDFHGKWLHIDADVRLTDRNGRELKEINRAAMKSAADVRETHPTWSWSDKPPPDWDK
jgi:hypothetical protein